MCSMSYMGDLSPRMRVTRVNSCRRRVRLIAQREFSRTAETGNPPDPMRAGIPVVRVDLDIDGRVIRQGRHRYLFLECGQARQVVTAQYASRAQRSPPNPR